MNKVGDAINLATQGGLAASVREVGSVLAIANEAYGNLFGVLKVIEHQMASDIAAVKRDARFAALKEVYAALVIENAEGQHDEALALVERRIRAKEKG